MLDPKWVREHPDAVKAAGRKKYMPCDELVDEFVAVDQRLRSVLPEVEGLRAEQKQSGKAVGKAVAGEREALLARQSEIKARIQELTQQEKELNERREWILQRLPNPPAAEVPEGKDDSQNLEVDRWGTPRAFDFEPLDHVTLGERHGLIDIPRASRIAGSRNYFLTGDGAMLEEAVLRMALEHMREKGFVPMTVPLLVRGEAMYGTAYFPGGEEQAYACEKDELYLIGTSEVSLTAFHGEEILDAKDLPRRYVARSSCFRREAGTYGKDTRGLYRVHQFQKVEQVIVDIADEERSKAHHAAILQNSREIVEALELPYRVVNVCGGDLGQGQVQKFDIETWMPSRGGYGETHSASRFHEFQARRLQLRYRGEDGKPRFCHTLNNTVVASPRILIALLENHQQADGSVRIPEALQPWFGRERIGGA